MDLKQMRYFLAVAEEQNFGRAAQRLHMAQPPLTRHIRALEDELGTALFVRTSKGAELTDAGRTLLAEVPNILTLTRLATEQTQLAGRGLLGRLDVGIFTSGILHVIPQLLATFHTTRPGVTIGLHNLSKADQIEALRERRITIGFNRYVPPEDDIVVETVLRERFIVALHEDHPLAHNDVVRLRDLEGEPMILYPNASLYGLAQAVTDAFADENVTLVAEQEVEDVVTAVGLAASRFGICITTASAANLRLPGLTYRPLDSDRLRYIDLSCLYRVGDTTPILLAFLEVVRAFRADSGGHT
ncbi:LysR substrate-binding domain-containing protein (plasmid) [Burkholderia sp. FERM BP-3421]|uniref:LysR substrate-binding domain-containing protein n=1 Tax=Burkholderia sp. FERM BP-3421 TaxID=1494466 RepID=UPI00235FEDBA|nr:LysR substrate-binding domain-containing protein [Burkholderia sp. FERM BP-3421]WDD90341.1 LysR substrate-binding domain-containing protein [Burkholderia sp. FERM BP-3421]